MSITPDEYRRISNMSREEMIAFICASGEIIQLSKEQKGAYLFGKTANGRAICLIDNGQNQGTISYEVVFEQAAHEVHRAGLLIPILFFGRSAHIVSNDFFTFAQIPYFFDQDVPLRRTLQTMDAAAKPRPIRLSEELQPLTVNGLSMSNPPYETAFLPSYEYTLYLHTIMPVAQEVTVRSDVPLSREQQAQRALELARNDAWSGDGKVDPDVDVHDNEGLIGMDVQKALTKMDYPE